MFSKIPPHIAWPGFIVFLFVLGASVTLSMVWIARSDGGAQVVDNYYEKAVNWDETVSRRNAVERLGWKAFVSVERDADNRRLRLNVIDRDGLPVSGLAGVVRLHRPEIAGSLAEVILSEDPAIPGSYRCAMPFGRNGLWDIEVEATLDTLQYWDRIRVEIR